MELFYKVSRKELLDIRNEIFVKNGIPALEKNGFERSPFTVANYGRNNLKDFTYDLCRVNELSHLEKITTHISRGDRYIKIFLNIFELRPAIHSLGQLKKNEGMPFYLPPNSIAEMRLRSGDFKGMPLFNFTHHKLKSFYFKSGYRSSVKDLKNLIESDLTDIDHFIKRWHELHQPMITDWEGNAIHKGK
ncbi:MAG: hypothetical protein V4592_10355 [Bacteroidota bacterium]